MQSKSYKRRLRRKAEKERQRKRRRYKVEKIVTQALEYLETESSDSDENSNELLEPPTRFCDQNQDIISSSTFLRDKSGHSGESHSDHEYEINNDSYLLSDSQEEFDQWSDNENTIDNSASEQFESNSDNDNDNENIYEFPNDEAKEIYVRETIREWVLKGVLSMKKLDDLLSRLNVVHPNLPTNYKTLLRTPSCLNIIELKQAQIWYKGIRFNLDAMLLEKYLETSSNLHRCQYRWASNLEKLTS